MINAIRVIRALGPVDARNVLRDPMLKWMLLLPLVAAIAIRWLLPPIMVKVGAILQIDLTPFYAPLFSYLLLMIAPLLAGMIVGFLLLDQKDDLTLSALQVTPLTTAGYLAYRLGTPVIISVVLTFIAFPLGGFPPIGWLSLLAVALVAAPLGPIFALLLGTFAANKVQGFALAKASSSVLIPPMIAWFVPEPWQWLFGVLPTYWPAKLYWIFDSGADFAAVYFICGLLVQLLILRMLIRRFDRQTRS